MLADIETFLGGAGVGVCTGVDADSCLSSCCWVVLDAGAEFDCTLDTLEPEFCWNAAVLDWILLVAVLLILLDIEKNHTPGV